MHSGQRLRLAREAAGLKIAEAARLYGVDETTIRRLEKSGRTPQITTQRCIAAALRVPREAIWPSPVAQAAQRRAA